MPTAVGQTKDGRSSYRLGRDKTALSIFGKHTQEEIGISLSALNNYFSKLEESDEPIYKNKRDRAKITFDSATNAVLLFDTITNLVRLTLYSVNK